MGWWITLGILALLAILPLGAGVSYDEDGVLVRLIIGPVKITLFPRPKKDKKPKKEKKAALRKEETPEKKDRGEALPAPKQESAPAQKSAAASEPVSGQTAKVPAEPAQKKAPEASKPAPKAETKSAPENGKKKKGGSLTDFLPLVKVALDFLGDFRRKLRVNVLELKLIMAADDPCDLAVNYGRAWAAVGNLMPRLERFLVIKKRNINVECDFTADETTVIARMELTITLGRLLAAVFVFAFRALVEFLKIMIKRKGGTQNEPKSSQHAE